MSQPDQIIESVPARIKVPANCTFEVFDKNGNMQAHKTVSVPVAHDVLLDDASRNGIGVDADGAPFKVVFSEVEAPQHANHDDNFEGLGI